MTDSRRSTRRGDRDILDPTQFPVQSKPSQEPRSAKPSRVKFFIPIPPTSTSLNRPAQAAPVLYPSIFQTASFYIRLSLRIESTFSTLCESSTRIHFIFYSSRSLCSSTQHLGILYPCSAIALFWRVSLQDVYRLWGLPLLPASYVPPMCGSVRTSGGGTVELNIVHNWYNRNNQ